MEKVWQERTDQFGGRQKGEYTPFPPHPVDSYNASIDCITREQNNIFTVRALFRIHSGANNSSDSIYVARRKIILRPSDTLYLSFPF